MMFFAPILSAQNLTYKGAVLKTSSSQSPGNFSSKNEGSGVTGIEKINPKLLNQFNKHFYHAANVKWQQIGDKFLATFADDETTTTSSLFSKNGKLIYIIHYSTEKQLPEMVKRLVNDKYEDYLITSVAQVLEKNREIWVVKLAGISHYKAVRVEDGEMEEVENFQKSN